MVTWVENMTEMISDPCTSFMGVQANQLALNVRHLSRYKDSKGNKLNDAILQVVMRKYCLNAYKSNKA